MKGKPVIPPVHLSATYKFDQSDDLIDVVQNRSGYLYSRWDNPSVVEVEKELAALEGYDKALGFEQTKDVMDRLKVIKLATSLGGVTSLANQSITNTHAALSPEDRARAGISESLVRLSVGIEPVEILIDDLKDALEAS